MAKAIAEEDLKAIETIVRRHPAGVTANEIARALEAKPPQRTLQYRLKILVDAGRLAKQGERRWVTYLPTPRKPDGAYDLAAARDRAPRLRSFLSRKAAFKFRPSSANRYPPENPSDTSERSWTRTGPMRARTSHPRNAAIFGRSARLQTEACQPGPTPGKS